MNTRNAALIAELSDELEPVRPMRAREGYAVLALAGAVTIGAVWMVAGLWDGVLTGTASPFFIIINGLLLLVALSAIGASIALASPHVGNRQDGPRWALAMLGVMPLAALGMMLGKGAGLASLMDPHALTCFAAGSATSALTFVALAWWLKRGAPVSTALSGTIAGVAAGAAGSFAYGLSCPIDGLAHLGIWHVLPVVLCGVLGRIALPRIIRW